MGRRDWRCRRSAPRARRSISRGGWATVGAGASGRGARRWLTCRGSGDRGLVRFREGCRSRSSHWSCRPLDRCHCVLTLSPSGCRQVSGKLRHGSRDRFTLSRPDRRLGGSCDSAGGASRAEIARVAGSAIRGHLPFLVSMVGNDRWTIQSDAGGFCQGASACPETFRFRGLRKPEHSGIRVPHSMTLKELRLVEPLVRALADRGGVVPAPIRTQGRPAASFLPIVNRLAGRAAGVKGRSPRSLILRPMRELMAQIPERARPDGDRLPCRHAAVVGVEGQARRVRALRAAVDVPVAAPGRLPDLMNRDIGGLRAIEPLLQGTLAVGCVDGSDPGGGLRCDESAAAGRRWSRGGGPSRGRTTRRARRATPRRGHGRLTPSDLHAQGANRRRRESQ